MHLGTEVAARDGHIDELIDPAQTRPRLASALATLGAGRLRDVA
jgi:hypothetical protein